IDELDGRRRRERETLGDVDDGLPRLNRPVAYLLRKRPDRAEGEGDRSAIINRAQKLVDVDFGHRRIVLNPKFLLLFLCHRSSCRGWLQRRSARQACSCRGARVHRAAEAEVSLQSAATLRAQREASATSSR